MSDYAKLTIKVEDPDTGVSYEHVCYRVTDLTTEQTYPEPERGPSGFIMAEPSVPTIIKVSFVPLADERGVWATTHVTGGPFGE